MSLYLVAGQGAPTVPNVTLGDHISTGRPRRYPSDTSDAEWEITAPYIPVGGTRAGAGGRPVSYARRDIVDAIRYVDHNGVVWRALPVDFPPWRTVYHYFKKWNRDATLNRMHNGLRERIREAEGRQAEPSAAALDSQTLRAAETVAASSRGYDGGKKLNGRKRHIAVDTCGCCSSCWLPAPPSRTVTAPGCCCGPSPPASAGSAWSGSTAPTVADPSRSVQVWD